MAVHAHRHWRHDTLLVCQEKQQGKTIRHEEKMRAGHASMTVHPGSSAETLLLWRVTLAGRETLDMAHIWHWLLQASLDLLRPISTQLGTAHARKSSSLNDNHDALNSLKPTTYLGSILS